MATADGGPRPVDGSHLACPSARLRRLSEWAARHDLRVDEELDLIADEVDRLRAEVAALRAAQPGTTPLQYRTSEGALLAWDGTRWVPPTAPAADGINESTDSPHGDVDATATPARPPAWVLGCTCGAEQDALPDANESTDSPHGDVDTTDATLVLADRLHQFIREAGFDCPEDEFTPLCWEIAQRLVIDSGAVRHEFVSRLGGAEAACTCGAAHFGVVNHAEAQEWWERHLVERRATPTPWPINVVCGDTSGPAGVGGECVLPPGHPHCDGIGGQWATPGADAEAR